MMRKTKIVCTMGPACRDEETLEALFKSGMNVVRMNFSHESHEGHKKALETIRAVRDRLGISAAILLDTRGPEIRLGKFKNKSVELKEGATFTLYAEERLGDEKGASVTLPTLIPQLSVDNIVLFDDGKIRTTVIAANEGSVDLRVENPGKVSDHKGINVPGVSLDMPYLSEQDKADLIFGIENDVDFIAASFVRSKDDVVTLRKFLDYNGGHNILIISKIENGEGINNFEEILENSNGIMVARGDMGVEVDYERLPGIQKKFIRRCYQSGKMVITATQMLESMISSPTPTRAEITDVANAVFDGTSAVMLSGETAMGKYPVQAVEVMARIAMQAERDAFEMNAYRSIGHDMDVADHTNAICDAACTTAKDIEAAAIIAVTKNGKTARRISKFRPYAPIVASTPSVKSYHQLALSWGVYPVIARYQHSFDDLIKHAVDCAKHIDIVHDGDQVVITAGIPLDAGIPTNMVKVHKIVSEQGV